MLYGGGGWQKTDMNGLGGASVSSNPAWTAGARVFLTKNWAIDANVIQSKHNLKYFGQKIGSYKLTGYSFGTSISFLSLQRRFFVCRHRCRILQTEQFTAEPRLALEKERLLSGYSDWGNLCIDQTYSINRRFGYGISAIQREETPTGKHTL